MKSPSPYTRARTRTRTRTRIMNAIRNNLIDVGITSLMIVINMAIVTNAPPQGVTFLNIITIINGLIFGHIIDVIVGWRKIVPFVMVVFAIVFVFNTRDPFDNSGLNTLLNFQLAMFLINIIICEIFKLL